jgi:hypothetical protein
MSEDFIIEPQDEYPHFPPPSVTNFNESVYVMAYDQASRVGGWMRLGNRFNEGHAELAVCLYLPDGKIACQFNRPQISTYQEFSAGGLTYEVNEPYKKIEMSYDGPLVIVDNPEELRNPKVLFKEAPRAQSHVLWEMTGCSPIHGGLPKNDSVETYYGRDFSLGHFNQHMKVQGHIKIADQKWEVIGGGWRDHSWGPRYWENIYFHRLFEANFDDGRALMLIKITYPNMKSRRLGVLLVDGNYEEVIDMDLMTEWNSYQEPDRARIVVKTSRRHATIDLVMGTRASLSNKRKLSESTMITRVIEASTAYFWDGIKGHGMAEYLDKIEDGHPVGFPL